MLRCDKNPLLTVNDVVPSQNFLKVDGIFNCGAIKHNDEYILLCRVAESVIQDNEKYLKVPIVQKDGSIDVIELDKSRKDLDFSDSRSIRDVKNNKLLYLSGLSHIRIAHSKNGIDFIVNKEPFIFPNAFEEAWGIEDPRVVKISDKYYINYTSVSKMGINTSLVETEDFINYKRLGIIFMTDNKDVTIFPEKINGKYYCLNRPSNSDIAPPEMWISKSPDLIYWGNHKHFFGISQKDSWDDGRIGGGAPPILTDSGYIKIYHAATKDNVYCLGAMLLDKNDPSIVLKKTQNPILEPEAKYEKEGFFGNVVFTCGCIKEGNSIKIYYGAADDKICLAETTVEEILMSME